MAGHSRASVSASLGATYEPHEDDLVDQVLLLEGVRAKPVALQGAEHACRVGVRRNHKDRATTGGQRVVQAFREALNDVVRAERLL